MKKLIIQSINIHNVGSDQGGDEDDEGEQGSDIWFCEEGGNDGGVVGFADGAGSGLAEEGKHHDEHEDEVLHCNLNVKLMDQPAYNIVS